MNQQATKTDETPKNLPALLVENARSEGLGNLSFLGVLSSSDDSTKLFTEYAKHGADAVITDVNDIPYILASLGGSV